MMDLETKSLWSHLLGRAMDGKLKGTVLEVIPSDMTTWAAWRKSHPQTTVLDMSRTHRAYTKQFYNQPERFVIGMVDAGKAYHISLAALMKTPVQPLEIGDQKLVAAFTAESTSARIFSRVVGDRLLTFQASGQSDMQDSETNSQWSRATGVCVKGSLAGKSLTPRAGIISYKKAWDVFHPNSQEIGR